MLRSEHVMARLSRGNLIPHSLSDSDEPTTETAAELSGLYAKHVGEPRAALEAEVAAKEEELGPRLDSRRGFRIVRAFGKLLEERCEWAAPAETDPYTLRTRIFELASELPELPVSEPDLLEAPTRDDILSRVATETGLEDPAMLMYADRQSAQILSEFHKPSPEELVHRYNVAQIQGVLYAARELTVDIGAEADARLVFHYVKKMGLIHRIEPTRFGYRLRLDGPLSIFGSTRRYGLALAKFLPGLILTEPWKLSATVEWKGRDASLTLDSKNSVLASHYLGPRQSEDHDEVREAFVKAWERAKNTGGWSLEASSEILPFPEKQAVLVPDFTLKNESGETVHLEILGFWTQRSLVERAALVGAANERGDRVLVAASENLGASNEALEEAVRGGVIPFKGRLSAKAVSERLSATG
jgi:predicted nuclease of restriction endonuclease-like RecB superfamily